MAKRADSRGNAVVQQITARLLATYCIPGCVGMDIRFASGDLEIQKSAIQQKQENQKNAPSNNIDKNDEQNKNKDLNKLMKMIEQEDKKVQQKLMKKKKKTTRNGQNDW